MKKIAFILALIMILGSALWGCDTAETDTTGQAAESSGDIEDTNMPEKTDTDANTALNQSVSSPDSTDDSIKEIDDKINSIIGLDDSPEWKQHDYFLENLDKNPYDTWLKNADGSREYGHAEPFIIYSKLWKDELIFTVESGKDYFDDSEAYIKWSQSVNLWIASAENHQKLIHSMLRYGDSKLFNAWDFGNLFRQKAIEAKRFILNFSQNENESIEKDIISAKQLNNIPAIEPDPYVWADYEYKITPYHSWLKAELANGDHDLLTIYANYCRALEKEIKPIIECGKTIFENEQEYEQWKTQLEIIIICEQNFLNWELQNIADKEQQLNAFISHCECLFYNVTIEQGFLSNYQYIQDVDEMLNRVPEVKG